jgi:hypothetical protein
MHGVRAVVEPANTPPRDVAQIVDLVGFLCVVAVHGVVDPGQFTAGVHGWARVAVTRME